MKIIVFILVIVLYLYALTGVVAIINIFALDKQATIEDFFLIALAFIFFGLPFGVLIKRIYLKFRKGHSNDTPPVG